MDGWIDSETDKFFKKLNPCVCRLETRAGINVAVSSLKPTGKIGRLETQAKFLWHQLEAEFFLLLETSVFALKALN